jgi:hypothetical protein
MKSSVVALLLATARLVSAHFELVYPYWRGDSFLPPASQYSFPCMSSFFQISIPPVSKAQADSGQQAQMSTPRALPTAIEPYGPSTAGLWSSTSTTHGPTCRLTWGLGKFTHGVEPSPGSSRAFEGLNLRSSSNTSTFNISLNPMLLNETGNGTICLPKWHLPAELGIVDGQDASLQIITIGDSGTALYNCADIRFSSNATILSGDACQNSTGVDIYPLMQQQANSTVNGAAATVTVTATPTGAASVTNAPALIALAGSALLGFVLAVAL